MTLTHDGASVTAERGEPLAIALLAAGRGPLSRSSKLHRPRGAWCLRGGCEGCLARVDGVPNVMTCRHAVRGGEVVETQNVVGTRKLDALRATDFLFPRGMDHHRLFAGVAGLSPVVQRIARRIAGLGRLPDATRAPVAAERRETDVLVVGGGATGLAAAAALGGRALLVDDDLSPGGTLALVEPAAAARWLDRARGAGARVEQETTALALTREPPHPEGRLHALLSTPRGAALVLARRVIVASGAHDTPPTIGNNDLPGVMSARAALRLWRAGVLPAERAVLAGEGPVSDALAREAGSRMALERVTLGALLGVRGRSAVRGVVLFDGAGERRVDADALIVDAPRAPSFELAVQAGATTRFDPARGFFPVVDDAGLAAPNLWCAGEVAGAAGGSAEDGERVARAVARSLG
ncbi:MAG: (2Fe-2S)-binding protein [Sorangiineae bacterium]|nr:(2Fe-2S)-binding protein [Polyangiaceae bacterium]MEB2320923.1 (2Fe-2S)-binding protein [Sorangiineae bacterium]